MVSNMFVYIQNFNEVLMIWYKLNAKYICISMDYTGIGENLDKIHESRIKCSYLEHLSKGYSSQGNRHSP